MKKAAALTHRRSPHSHRHRVKPTRKTASRPPETPAASDFVPEPRRKNRAAREKAAREFLSLQ
jgi:hypothetical protein